MINTLLSRPRNSGASPRLSFLPKCCSASHFPLVLIDVRWAVRLQRRAA